MSDFERINVVRVKECKTVETDKEMVHRFATQLFKDVSYISQFGDCEKIFELDNCEICPIYKNKECGFKTIEHISHDLMWKLKPIP